MYLVPCIMAQSVQPPVQAYNGGLDRPLVGKAVGGGLS